MPEMRDDFNDYSNDPSAQKSVTDWLMRVIARKEDAVLHHDEAPKKKATDSPTALAVQDSSATAVNGSNGAHSPQDGPQNGYTSITGLQIGHDSVAASQNGHSHSAPHQDAPSNQPQNGNGSLPGLQNGHGPVSASSNGHSYSAPVQDAHAAPSQNGHAASPIIDVFGDVFSTPSQNGNGFAASNGHSNGAVDNGFEFSADDLCGPPAFGPVPKVHREEITADDLCWVPKPQVTESYRNGNGHHEPMAIAPEPVMAAPSPEFLERLIAAPAVSEPELIVPEQNAVAEPVEVPQAAAGMDWHDPLTAAPVVSELEQQMIDATAEVPVTEEPVVEAQPKTTPEQWLEQMMSMAKATPEPQAAEAQPSVAEVAQVAEAALAEPVVAEAAIVEPAAIEPAIAEPSVAHTSVAPDFYEPLRAVEVPQPEVILPEPQIIDAPVSVAAEVVPVAEVAAPEVAASPEVAAAPDAATTEPAKPEVVSAVESVIETAPQTEQAAAGSEQGTNLVPVERRRKKRPSVSIADICRDWVVEEMEANGGVPEPEEYEEESDFLADEDTIVQTPESVFAHEGIWGNAATPGTGENGQQSPIPEIEGAQGQARSGNRNSSGMKALLRLGTLLPWLAREMEAGNDQNAALTQEVRHEVSGMRLVQYEIRSTVHDHSLQLKRVEEQLTRVRESIQAETSGTEELVETVKSTTKAISFMGIGIISVLVVLLGMMIFLIMHSR